MLLYAWAFGGGLTVARCRTQRPTRMGSLNKGWFIPAIIAGAAACTVAFWLYLNTMSEPIADRFSRFPAYAVQSDVDPLLPPSADTKSPQGPSSAHPDATDPVATPTEKRPSILASADPISHAESIPKSNPDSIPLASGAQRGRAHSSDGSSEARISSSSDARPEAGVHSDIDPQVDSPTKKADSTRTLVLDASDNTIPKRGRLRPLKRGIERYLLARLDDIDFIAMELDRLSLRWRSNISRDPAYVTLAAWLTLHAGDVDAADRTFCRAIALRSDYLPALRGRAMAMLDAHEYVRAAAAFRDLCEAYPSDAEAHYNHGVLLSRVGRLGEAADSYRRALDVSPRHVRSLYNLAAIAQRDGRLSDARDLWSKFTQVEPNVISVWFNLGIVHMDYNEPLKAARCFEAAVSINPQEIVPRINLALAYLEAGHLETAESVLLAANEDAPCAPAVLDALCETNRRLADWSAADRSDYLARAQSIESELLDMRPPDIAFEQVAGDPVHGETAGLIGP